MVTRSALIALAFSAAVAAPVHAQLRAGADLSPSGTPSLLLAWPGKGGYLGLSPGRTRSELACGRPGFACDTSNAFSPAVSQMYGGYTFSRNFAVEVGTVDVPRGERPAAASRNQGVNLSLVGRARLGDTWGLVGRLGTSYARQDTSAMGAAGASGAERGFGLAYGAGVSWAFSERGSATLGFDSYAVPAAGGGRETVRSTNLGLQWRY